MADLFAKRGAQVHNIPPCDLEALKQGELEYQSLVAGVIHVLKAWPSCSQQFGKISRTPRPKVVRQGVGHIQSAHGKCMRCLRCLRVVSGQTSSPCVAPNPTIRSLLEGGAGSGHKLHWARCEESDAPIIFCVLCGGSAS
eukprot:4832364-Pyramimonas_sp.AAC.1